MNRINRIIIGLAFCIMIVSLNIVNSGEQERAEIQINQLNETISIYADSNLGILKLNNGFLHGRDENSPDINETLLEKLKPEEWKLYKANSYVLAKRHKANITYGLSDHYAWSQGGFPEANPWENWSYYEEYILYNMQAYDDYFYDYPVDFYNIWNEPDHPYYWHGTYEQLLELYYRAYTVIKSYNPDAKVVGPSISWFRPGFPEVKGIIDFLVDLDSLYGVKLDAISWHENGGYTADTKPEDIPYRAQYLRSQIQENFPSDYKPELHVNEYLGGIVHLSPGWNVGFLKYLEEAKIEKAMRACWYTYSLIPYDYCSDCWYGLNGMFMSDGQTPQRVYWIQYTHSEMEGHIKLDVIESDENTNAIAIRNDSTNQLKILVGRYHKSTPSDVSIHIDYPFSGEYVFVKIENVPNDPTFYDSPPQMIPMPYGPILVSNDLIRVENNEINIVLDNFEDGDAYIITITPGSPSPVLSFNPTSFDFGSMLVDESDSTSFDVWNSGTGDLSYSFSESCGWVDVSPVSGMSSGEHDVISVDVDTTGLSVGSYQCDIVISSDGGSGVFSVYLNIVDVADEELDQEQTNYNRDFRVYSDRHVSQSFIPTLDTLTSIDLYIKKIGNPSDDFYVIVREEVDSHILRMFTMSENNIPTSYDWVSFDFDDVDVTPGETYYLAFMTSGGGFSDCYSLGYSTGNPYNDGSLWFARNADSGWFQYNLYDFTFKTYGVPSGPPIPVLTYTPATYDFGNLFEGVTSSTSFDVWNSGTGDLSYSFSESCGWVDVSPVSGMSSGKHDVISVDVDTTGLSVGSYQCDIVISSDGGSGVFSVYVDVIPPSPILSFDPVSHDFGSLFEGVTSSTSFDVWNSGTGDLSYSFSESCGWVDVSPVSGISSGEHDVISVDVDTTGLSVGSYQCDIVISSDGGSGVFSVYVNVIPPSPILSFDPVSHDFGSLFEGVTSSTSFDVWNSGTGDLSYSFSESCGWVDVSPVSGMSSGEHDVISVDVDTTGLSVGSYQCDIVISSDGGSGVFSVYLNIVNVADEELDQEQTNYNRDFRVYSDRHVSQSFIPTLDTLTSIDLYIKKIGNPSDDFYVLIREEVDGGILRMFTMPEENIPLSYDWVSFDFDDVDVTPGETYYLAFITSGGGFSDCYSIGYSTGNPYDDGSFWFARNAESGWFQYNLYDFTFKTYGVPSGPPIPVLTYTPATYDFGNLFEGVTSSTGFDVWNSGTGDLSYSFSESCGWVDVSPVSGISSGEHDTVSVDVDTSGLSVGSYQCDIVISSDGGSGVFSVFVDVIPPSPILSFDPASYDFGNLFEGVTSSTGFDVWNSGTGDLSYSFSESCGWVDVSPVSGISSGEHDTVSVDVDTSGLSVGSYQCDIVISSDGGSGVFSVFVDVIPPSPILSFDPASYDFGSLFEGVTSSSGFDVWNSGTGDLSYSFSESCGWVDVSPVSGISSGEHDTVSVDVDTSGLSVGSYQCDIVISSDGGSGVFSVYLNIVDVAEEELDQEQTVYNRDFRVYSDRHVSQSFIPTLDTLTSIDLYIKKIGNPSDDLVIAVRDDLNGPNLLTYSISKIDLLYSYDWISIDFDDVDVTPGGSYYIVVMTSEGGFSDCYSIGYSNGNPYSDGSLWFARNSGSSWFPYILYDFTFRSYGV